ncbi:MAG: hypothetical protein ACRDNE_07435, partial [Gaiellaceae bacterium]
MRRSSETAATRTLRRTRRNEAGRDDGSPDFSPDGNWIVSESSAGAGRTALYLVRPNGSGLRHLGIAGSDPSWRPCAHEHLP